MILHLLQNGKLTEKYNKLILFIAFLLMHLAILKIQGFVFIDEAAKYIELGDKLYENGEFGEQKYIAYLPVILSVYVCRLLHLPLEFILLLQSIIAFIAVNKFYLIATRLSNHQIGFFAALFLAVCFPIQKWNLTLYSESFFISLTIFFLYQLFIWKDDLFRNAGWLVCWIIVISSSRPHGLLFIPTLLLFLFIVSRKQKHKWIIAGIALFLFTLMFLMAYLIFTGGGGMDVLKPFKENHVLCYIPAKALLPDLDLIETGNSVTDLLYYIKHNKIHFLKLTLLKLKSFFIITRPHYSTINNGYLYLLMLLLYPMSAIGIFSLFAKPSPYLIYLLFTILFYSFGCTLQCDDWHGRFTAPVLPHLILLSAVGWHYLSVRSGTNDNTI